MTDVVEAMARGLVAWRYNQVLGRDDKIFALWKALNADLWAAAINGARAAIRAVTEAGGLVVEKMPEDAPQPASVTGYAAGVLGGYNTALREVRAAAVEVK